MDYLTIISFNCNSVRKSIDIIKDMCNSYDIILLQEIMLLSDDFFYLNDINKNFNFYAIPSTVNNSFVGRPKGGLCILWKKSLNLNINIKNFSPNFLGFQIYQENSPDLMIINTYMCCDMRNAESMYNYKALLADLASVIADINNCNLVIIGDFNADPFNGRFWQLLKTFCHENSLLVFDFLNLSNNSFSYISPSHNTTSWLDHVITSNENIIQDCNIPLNFSIYDHMPISIKVSFSKSSSTCSFSLNHNQDKEFQNIKIDLQNINENTINVYKNELDSHLNKFNISIFQCNNIYCNCNEHINHINNCYDHLIDCMKLSAISSFGYKTKNNLHCVPGWNEHCRSLYNDARSSFLDWCRGGKIRHGILYDAMKQSRSAFRKKLNYCKLNRDMLRNQAIAHSFSLKNKYEFWKQIKNITKKSNCFSSIDNETNENKIADIFMENFKKITDELSPSSANSAINFNNVHSIKKLSVEITKNAIKNLKIRNGPDDVNTILLLNVSDKTIQFMTDLFNSIIIHGIFPKNMTIGKITPIIKDKFHPNNSNNYRPIMCSNNLFKVFEYSILPILESFAEPKISKMQFGFSKSTSTLMSVFILQEIVQKYTSHRSEVYCAFIDLCKVFDTLDHNILFAEMEKIGIPLYIIRIFKALYSNLFAYVNINKSVNSREYKIFKGVRQGGITSPVLFKIYINIILKKFQNVDVGCFLDLFLINIIGYADDLVLISPSSKGLQILLNVLNEQLLINKLTLNVSKSKIMCFAKKPSKVNHKFYFDNNQLEIVNHYKYLGVTLSSNLSNNNDIERCNKQFLGQSYMLVRKFSGIPSHILFYLFKTYCLSFYGCGLWPIFGTNKSNIHACAVSYHKTIKKIQGIHIGESNHLVCNNLNTFLFNHFINYESFLLLRSLHNSQSKPFNVFKNYLINESYLHKNINKIFMQNYNFNNVLNNDKEAVKAAIMYVQIREHCSLPLSVRNRL